MIIKKDENIKHGGNKKMANKWLEHVKNTQKKHPNMKYKDVLKEAKKSYKK